MNEERANLEGRRNFALSVRKMRNLIFHEGKEILANIGGEKGDFCCTSPVQRGISICIVKRELNSLIVHEFAFDIACYCLYC